MFISSLLLLLTPAPAQFADPPALVEPQSALDCFPADTGGLIELNLGPWLRLGRHTAIHHILPKKSSIESSLRYGLEMLSGDPSIAEQVDLAAAMGGMRFYMGLPIQLFHKGAFMVGIDFVGEDAHKVLDLIRGTDGIYFQRNFVLMIIPFDDYASITPTEQRRTLDQFVARAIEEDGNSEPPTLLRHLPSWRRMRSELHNANQFFGMWLPAEPWKKEAIKDLYDLLNQGQEEAEVFWGILTKIAKRVELERLNGIGFTAEIAPPILRDRFVILGDGVLPELYQPYSRKIEDTWRALENCNRDVTMAQVGGFDFSTAFDLIVTILGKDMGAEGREVLESPLAQEAILPFLAFLDEIDGGFVQEASGFDGWANSFNQLSIPIANVPAARKALEALPPEFPAMYQLAIAEFDGMLAAEWRESSLVFMPDVLLDGDGILAERGDFRQTLPKMKAAVGEGELLWAAYYTPEFGFVVLQRFLDLLSNAKVNQYLPKGWIDFEVTEDESSDEVFMPGYRVVVRHPGMIVSVAESPMSLMLAGVAAKGIVDPFNGLFEDDELKEDEF